MILSSTQITFLQRLAIEKPAERGHSAVAEFFLVHCGIGSRKGRGFVYTEKSYQEAISLLIANGLPLTPLPAGSSRSDAIGLPSEKTGTKAPHYDSVAIKVASGACLLGGHPLPRPEQGIYSVLTVAQATAVTADRLLLVENVETFRTLEKYRWLDYQGLNVVAILLGDNLFKADRVDAVIRARAEPVWAFFDFDPNGLGRACSLPRLDRIILPASGWLDATTKRVKRSDLFADQINQWRSTIERSNNAEISAAWRLLSRLEKGLPQEWMIDAP